MSQLFSQTIRETPTDAELTSHQLLLRAGFIQQHEAGLFSYLPLARRSIIKIENIIRQEINLLGGQEISTPMVHPTDLWEESELSYKIGNEVGRFKDKHDHAWILSMTHEAVIAALARKQIRSYRQLPQLLYHFQTKWCDDPHPRTGLMKPREYSAVEICSLDIDWQGLDNNYEAFHSACQNIFHRCNLPVLAINSDPGLMGGSTIQEFIYITENGEETIFLCEHCGYSAKKEIAKSRKQPIEDAVKPVEKVATPGSKTIEDLANYLNIPTYKTAKAVFIVAKIPKKKVLSEQFVIAIVRGDMEVNEIKLAKILNSVQIRPALDEEIRATGAYPGYASPVGLRNVFTVVDDLIPVSYNLVSGANMDGYHLLNVNYGRDYQADIIADITAVHDGDACFDCGYPLRSDYGMKIGTSSKRGSFISETRGCHFLDQNGQSHPIMMGSYSIGIGSLLSCIAEAHHDQYGLVWPIVVAPYQIHLISLPWKQSNIENQASNQPEKLYQTILSEQIECLYDDRQESPGVKFNDADLIGNPIRLTISERSIKNGGIEYKRRDLPEKMIIPLENIVPVLQEEINQLKQKNIIKKH
jgi:prolyl-tRNA synthetase